MNRIKEVLQERGIKQKWLAEKLCKSFKIVNNYAWIGFSLHWGNFISNCGDAASKCEGFDYW